MKSDISLNRLKVRIHGTKFLGYGNPKTAKMWFVGLEENRELISKNQLDDLPRKLYLHHPNPDKSSSVYTIISKIVTGLKNQNTGIAWRHYKSRILFKAGGECLLANLYPLGKKTEQDWPSSYSDWLDMDAKQYYKWIQTGQLPRFKFIYNCRQKYGEPLTVCFGKNHWRYFCECLAGQARFIEVGPFKFCLDRNLVLTEFFRSTRMSDSTISHLVDYINKFDLNPFASSNCG